MFEYHGAYSWLQDHNIKINNLKH